MSHPETMSVLRAENLALGYDGTAVVTDLTFDVPTGSVTSIIGPNGCGKSTLLRGLGRLIAPRAGRVLLDGKPIGTLPTRQVARRVSILPQSPSAPPGLTVADLVSRGRHPRQRWYEQFSVLDEATLRHVLNSTGMLDLAGARLEELSGGQRQRAWISMTLAQETDIMLLDEPTTYLDLAHQVELLELIVRMNREHNRTVLMVLHDISLAARYSDHLVAMKNGAIVTQGAPEQVVRPDVLRDVFGLAAQVVTEPTAGRPHVIPL
ncbi:ABC transporter ATP-binding protein [Nocardia fusca]|uniref:ABC transporter ATP-binding protein n=2 Tax=Nocardia fusca TaxID=941183 RepID=A0ABV3FFS9_9NOCA